MPKLDTFEDFQMACGHLADGDSVDGYISISKAAVLLGLSDAHLSAILAITSDFCTAQSIAFFSAREHKAHVVGICTSLFIQFLGRHVHHLSPLDHFPGGLAIPEAASEQVELNKSTPSRGSTKRTPKSGAGPTKAHRQHLAHVLKQRTAVEKALSEQLAKYTVPFLQLLKRLLKLQHVDSSFLACLALLFEYQDGAALDARAWCQLSEHGHVDIEDLSAQLADQLQILTAAPRWPMPVGPLSALSGRMRSVHEDDAMSEGSSISGNDDVAHSVSSMASSTVSGSERPLDTRDWDKQDIVGTSRTTALRGESDMGSRKINIIGCHEASVYCLAPMKHVYISCCTDCIIVVGACGGCIRVEKCERMHIVAASLRLTIATCHDCTFNVAVNTQPLLAGDNRFIQMAPFNAQYEHLMRHLREAGVARVPNHWNNPLEFARDSYQLKSPRGAAAGPSDGGVKLPVALMPPDEFLPFMVPFKGGPGPLCGGASLETFQWSPDSYSTEKQHASRARPDIFPFPPEYAEALQNKIVRVATMRSAVKTSFMDQHCKQEVQAVIQAYFKDWLMNSNNIRQVYDLARLERENAKASVPSAARSASDIIHE